MLATIVCRYTINLHTELSVCCLLQYQLMRPKRCHFKITSQHRPIIFISSSMVYCSVYVPTSVWRIRDVYPGSDFFPSQIPDLNCLHPGSQILIKEFKYFNPKKAKKWFLSSKNMIRVVHHGSRIRMLTFSHPGSRIQGSKRHPIPDPDPQHCPTNWG